MPAEVAVRTLVRMCRNITVLRGLTPPATPEEIEAAVAEVTATTTRLLAELPARRQPPTTVPPLRRPEVQARIAARARS